MDKDTQLHYEGIYNVVQQCFFLGQNHTYPQKNIMLFISACDTTHFYPNDHSWYIKIFFNIYEYTSTLSTTYEYIFYLNGLTKRYSKLLGTLKIWVENFIYKIINSNFFFNGNFLFLYQQFISFTIILFGLLFFFSLFVFFPLLAFGYNASFISCVT